MPKKSARDRSGAATPAVAALHRAGISHTVHSYEHDPAAASWGGEAAEALGVDPARVFKTLMIDLDGGLAVAIVPVDRQLDLKAAAQALGGKRAAMAHRHVAERATGYVAGGISPIGQKRAHSTVIDDSASAWPTLYVSAGRRGMDVEVTPADLIALTRAQAAPIAR